MAKYFHPDVLDKGLENISAQITLGHTLKLHLLKAYTQGATYATVTGNSIGSNLVALTTGDCVIADNTGLGRKLTIASKSILVSAAGGSGATPNLHVAVLDETASKVLLVTDETTDEVLVQGDARQIPAAVFGIAQPT